MKRPAAQVLSALYVLESNKEFAVVMEWITESLQDEVDTLLNADAAKVHKHQGYCLALTDLIEHATQARESLRKTGRSSAI